MSRFWCSGVLASWAACWAVATEPADAPPRRIIAMAPNAAQIICGLGACDRLVGVSSFCTEPPELQRVPKIGGLRDPDLETILALKPELLILRGQSDALKRLCAEQKIAVYEDRVESLEDVYTTIGELGRRLQVADRATEMTVRIRRELADVAARTKGHSSVRVLLTLRGPQELNNLLTIGGGSFLSQLIDVAGGQNIYQEQQTAYPAITLEDVVQRNPQVIIELMTGETFDDAQRAALRAQWDGLRQIDAVRTGRIHILTESYISVPSQGVTRIADTFASLLHPEPHGGE